MVSKKYLIKVLPVVAWLVSFIFVFNLFDEYTKVYCSLVFYFGIILYFYILKDWNFIEWFKSLKEGKSFWLPVLFTIIGMLAAFGIGMVIPMMFPDIDTGISVYRVNNWANLTAFALVTVFLAPIANEVFYRKAIIVFNSKSIIIISTIISIFLYAAEHSLKPFGFLIACLWAIPFSIAYIKTKNIYVT